MRTERAAIAIIAAVFGAAVPCGAEFIEVANPGFPDSYASGVWGDYNGDGYLDLLLGWEFLNTTKISRNLGGCFFKDLLLPVDGVADFPFSSGHPNWAAWADFDRDGNLDFAIWGGAYQPGGSYQPWRTKLYRNNGNGTFTALVNPLGGTAEIPGRWSHSCSWGDYDNDGDPDLAVCGSLYRNEGNGIFTAVNAGFQYVENGDAAWGDFDNDGWLDLVLCGEYPIDYHHAFVYRNNGNGTFTALSGTGIPPMGNYPAVALGDYDNDGLLDIALAGQLDNAGGTWQTGVWRNNGNGTFTAANTSFPPLRQASLAWGDYSADGCLDLAAIGAPYGGDPPVPSGVLFQGNAHGQFTVDPSWMLQYDDITEYSYARWGDADNDGRLDLYLSWWSDADGTNRLLRNVGDPAGPVNSWVNERPDAPTLALQYGAQFTGAVTLHWNAVTGDETPAAAMTYNLRVGTSPGACDVVSADADSSHPTNNTLLGNVQNGTFAKLKVPAGNIAPKQYYWAVQAVDGGYRRSEWSRESMFVRPPKGAPIAKPTPGGATSTR